MKQDYAGGKYTVIFDRETSELRALRNGDAWKDLTGDKLTYCMLMEHKLALEQNYEMLKVLLKVQEDLNWMTNSNKLLNRFVFNYVDETIAKIEGAKMT
jgi:hypothetical protein